MDILGGLTCRDLESLKLTGIAYNALVEEYADELPMRRVHLALVSDLKLYIQLDADAATSATFTLGYSPKNMALRLGQFFVALRNAFVASFRMEHMTITRQFSALATAHSTRVDVALLHFVDVRLVSCIV